MVNIFTFIDFREYLRHYYEDKKSGNPHFSYRYLAEKAGFNNKGFVFKIIKGIKKITKSHCFQLSEALGHSKKEAEYFENIVAYAQAKNDKERSYFLKEALRIVNNTNAPIQMIRKDQFEYYATWYHSAIRSIIDIIAVTDNYQEICNRLNNTVTIPQVKKSIKLLERLELIAKDNKGVYHLTKKSIRTSKEITQTARNQFHTDCIELAKKALQIDPPTSRNAISITMGISTDAYRAIVDETQAFVTTLANIVKNDAKKPERVYQYELLLFPLSNNGKKRQPL
jgi:uncharacterized protein (TIGR02147 family)